MMMEEENINTKNKSSSCCLILPSVKTKSTLLNQRLILKGQFKLQKKNKKNPKQKQQEKQQQQPGSSVRGREGETRE